MTKFRLDGLFGFLAVLITLASPAQALVNPVYVSSTGSGTSCSAGTPCNLSYALTNASDGTSISCINGGNLFGFVTVQASITIDCPGAVFIPSANASNTPPGLSLTGARGQVVTLRNLTFEGSQSNSSPFIQVSGGATLIIENCKFQNLGLFGNLIAIQFLPNSPAAQLIIRDTVFSNNGIAPGSGGGLQVAPGSGGSASVLLERVSFHYNITSMVLAGAVSAVMKNSTVTASRSNGIIVTGGATLDIDDSQLVFNVGSAIGVSSGSTVRLSNNTIKNNQTGVSNSGGSVLSYSNNRIVANGTNGTPLATIQGGQ